jgi:hypothetical protein
MAAGDTLQGRRVESVKALYDGQAGDYVIVHPNDPQGIRHPEPKIQLFFRDPTGAIGRASKHEITECEDGTVTVSPSILATSGEHGHDWHGYLEHGIWREL